MRRAVGFADGGRIGPGRRPGPAAVWMVIILMAVVSGARHPAVAGFESESEGTSKTSRRQAATERHGKALAALRERNVQTALARVNEAIAIDPTFAAAYLDRAGMWGIKGDLKKCIADCDTAIQLDPHFTAAYRLRGMVHTIRQEFDRAIADFDEVIRLNPLDVEAYRARGRTRMDRRQFDRAVADFDQVVRLTPRDWRAYNDRGTAWARLGDSKRAITDFGEVIRLDPKSANGYILRGQEKMLSGQFAQAEDDFIQALRLEPGHAVALQVREENARLRAKIEKEPAEFAQAIRRDRPPGSGSTANGLPLNVAVPAQVFPFDNKGVAAIGFEDAPPILDRAALNIVPLGPPIFNLRDGLTPRQKQAAILAATQACGASDWKDPAKLDMLAAACDEAGDHDAATRRRAASAATQLCALSNWRDPDMLDDLAAAWAEAGDLPLAARWQAQANDLRPAGKARTEGERRLKLYRAGKPDRQATH